MKNLRSLNKYFARYRGRLVLGIVFIAVSNIFAVWSPVIVRQTMDSVQQTVLSHRGSILSLLDRKEVYNMVFKSGALLLGFAVLRGAFMFAMRQTVIVMSRHIEYDQKQEIYAHYQQLPIQFYKTHFTGDLMNRISEDVSRVRQYTGPAIMYAINLTVLAIMCIWGMLRVNTQLTVFVIAPLPFLAIAIYYVNKIINRKTEKIQAQLSGLTTTAQEAYSGIRVIKSFVQEKTMLGFFNKTSEEYRDSAVNLSLTEAIYFPSMNFFVGLSMLITVMLGGYLAIKGEVTAGNIAEFVIYINLLMFPVSSLGMLASMVHRAAVSQRRIDEFLNTQPDIFSPKNAATHKALGRVSFKEVGFTYPHTGIRALQHFSLTIEPGEKVAIIGKTGSGKSTLAHLILRMYDVTEGELSIDGKDVKTLDLQTLRSSIGYAPQEAFLFSDTIYNNIKFGREDATEAEVKEAARMAGLEKEIAGLEDGYKTMVGERGVMLSGGQKQRMVLARAILKNSHLLLLDECLSAVDTRTEQFILNNLRSELENKTVIVITHRIFASWTFDKIIVLDDGSIAEQGTHATLMELNGRYARLYKHQTATSET